MTSSTASSELNERQFARIARLAQERWGLHLTSAKFDLVSNRLSRFLRKAPFRGIGDYLNHLEDEATEEDLLMFFDVLSTNVTSFFREREHFDYLEREFYTPLARGNLTLPGKRIRIWSAACSTGPEPYTIGIHAHMHLPDIESWDVRILASDLSNSALESARSATYPEKLVEHLDESLVKQFFLRRKGDSAGQVRVGKSVRDMVTIKQLNLMESWPLKGPFGVIFCRNVMIYFDKPTRCDLVNRLCRLLRPGGILIVGSAETLAGLDVPVRTVQPSVYQL